MSLFPRMSRAAVVLTATFGLLAATALPILPGMSEMIPSAAASGTTVTRSIDVVGSTSVTIDANDVLKLTFTNLGGGPTACDLFSTIERIAGLDIVPPTPSTGTNLCSPSVQYTFTPSEAGFITWQFGFTSLTVNVLPVITSITPSSGPLAGGETVTIAGFGFTKATFGSLSWTTSLLLDGDTNNKVPMAFTTATSATAVIPGGAAEGAQKVTVFAELFNNGASMSTFLESTTSTTYTYLPPAPTITSVLPGSGVGPSLGGPGTEVTIRGTNMKGVTGVTFGGVAAQIYFVDSNDGEYVEVEAPSGTGTVDVAVTGPGGTSTRSNAFTYVLIPTITSISPTTGADSGGTLVTVTGTNFDPSAMVAALVIGQNGEIVTLQAGGTSTSVSFVTPAITAGSYTVLVGDPNNPARVAQAAVPFIVTSGGPGPNPNPNPPGPTPASAPENVVAVSRSGGVGVSWSAPASSGAFPVSMYRASTVPGGASCVVPASVTSCELTGLSTGVSYVVDVQALTGAGWSPSARSNPVTPGGVTPAPAPVVLPGPLAAGESVLLVNGVPDSSVRVDPNTSVTGLTIQGDGWSMDLDGLGPDGRPLSLGPNGVLRLQNERDVATQGTGFLPNSDVDLYVDPPVAVTGASMRAAATEAIYVGTVRTDAQGSFAGVATLPADIAPGEHVLQAVGFSSSLQSRAMNLGVIVEPSLTLDQGTRVAQGRHERIRTTGSSAGVEAGTRLTPWIRYSGQSEFAQGRATIRVQSDGSFTWTRKIRKDRALTAYVSWNDLDSNRVTWKKVR